MERTHIFCNFGTNGLIAFHIKIYRNSPVTKKLQPILDLKRSKLYMKTAKGNTIKVFKAFMIEK